MAAALLSMTVLVTTSAGAAENDDFAAVTTDGCGVAQFKDYGPGAPGGGNNDDYVVIHDYCADGHGVIAYLSWGQHRLLVQQVQWQRPGRCPRGLGSVPVWERQGWPDGLVGGVPCQRAG